MTFNVISPDVNGTIEGVINQHLLSYLPTSFTPDATIVPLSRSDPNFKFDQSLYNIKGPVILVDFFEYNAHEWDRMSTHIWGQGAIDKYRAFFDHSVNTMEWRKVDKWVSECPPAAVFKRELLAKDVTPTLLPIDYPCYILPQPLQTKSEYMARPLDVLFHWGYSHAGRRRVHGDIFKKARDYGYDIITEFSQLGRHIECRHPTDPKNLWASVYTPHFDRVDISRVVEMTGKSKITLSMPGNGVKCFRHTEAPVNSVMAMHDDNLAWSIPWTHNINCLKISIDKKSEYNPSLMMRIGGFNEEVEEMWEALNCGTDLYGLYCESLQHIDRYRSERYVKEYFIPAVEKILS